MNYATGYAITSKDLFISLPTNKLKISSKECEDIINNKHKRILARKIFIDFVQLVIEDIIENNNTFSLPTSSKRAELGMKRFNKELFSKARRYGKWKDVDFLTSNFSAYQPFFHFQSKGVMREKLIYLNPKYRDRITELTNQGKQYY